MKQFLISEDERISILSKHKALMKEQHKSLINEQQNTSLDILRKAVKGGCLRNGQLVQSKLDPTKYIYRAKTDSGLDIDFFGDMTYKFRESGKTGKWKMCQQAIDMETNAANTAAANAEIKKDNDAKIASLKQQNYKTKEELVAAGADLNTLDRVYDKVTVGQVNLYRQKGDATKIVKGTGTKQFDDDQQAFIEKYERAGYVVPGVTKGYDRTKVNGMRTVTAIELDPRETTKDLFPNGLTLYYDPNKQKNIKSDKSLVSDLLKNQAVDREACRKNVEDYYRLFKTNATIDPSILYKVKTVVQACKNQHYGKWGVLGGGKKLDEYLDILSGVKEGGPMSYGEGSVWRLK
jgi:hypothetical protein